MGWLIILWNKVQSRPKLDSRWLELYCSIYEAIGFTMWSCLHPHCEYKYQVDPKERVSYFLEYCAWFATSSLLFFLSIVFFCFSTFVLLFYYWSDPIWSLFSGFQQIGHPIWSHNFERRSHSDLLFIFCYIDWLDCNIYIGFLGFFRKCNTYI